MRDLFGEEVRAPVMPGVRKRGTAKPRGYFGPPGAGPKGETCKGCQHLVRVRLSSKVVYKCGEARAKWTGGRGSDILLRSPACIRWEAQP